MNRFEQGFASFLFVFLLAPVEAQVTVSVTDQDLGTPLEGVKLFFQGSDQPRVTDKDGKVSWMPPRRDRVVIRAEMLGYKTKKGEWLLGQTGVQIVMEINSSLEGDGIEVSAAKPQASDSAAGVSEVVDKAKISQATMGIIEDAFSAVKNLPGVGYTGSLSARPSINGGDPNETVATLDGAYILNPYQWQGAFTIFNPTMVDSIKLSSGVIPTPYGQVMSGLLDVSSRTPQDDQPHFDLGISTTGADAYLEKQFGPNQGFMFAAKSLWLEVPLSLVGASNLFTTAPYMFNLDGKVYGQPASTVRWSLTAHYDSDGVAAGGGSSNLSLTDSQELVVTTVKVMVTDDLLWSSLVSFNRYDNDLNSQFPVSSSNLTNTSLSSEQKTRYQVKETLDWPWGPNQLMTAGIEEVYETWSTVDRSTNWTANGDGTYSVSRTDVETQGMNTVESGLFLNDQIQVIPGIIKAEVGARVDHAFAYGDNETLLTYPVFNPRALVTWTALKNWNSINSFNVYAGSALYSQFPADNQYLSSQYGVKSWDVGPSQAWFNEIGVEALGNEEEKLTLEGYSKYYFHRFYTADTTTGETVLKYDGTGYVLGLNVGLSKSTRMWDLSTSYTFAFAKLNNPGGPGLSTPTDADPVGSWYSPSYNRFHSFYGSVVYKPNDGFSTLVDGNLASGTPDDRSHWDYPINIKLDWHGYYDHSKTRWEFYLACQDILSKLYYVQSSTSVSFSTGTPIPSVGYKLSF